jgi:integrase
MGVKVRQKEKGKGQPWWVFINHNNKRTSRQIGDRRAAEAVGRKIEAKLSLGEFSLDEKKKAIPLFKDFAQEFMGTYSKLNHKESTRDSYRDVLRIHINPVFGDKRLDEIERKDIKQFVVSKQTDGLSASTARLILSYFSAILAEAVDDELVIANPATGVRKVIGKNDANEIRPLTADELNHLLEIVREHFPKYYVLFLLLARTGMRIGEALSLQWGDIDFHDRFIEVKRSVVRGRVSTPKSRKSRRVDMSPQLTDALLIHQTESKKKGLRLGVGELELVFTNEGGNVIDVNNWRSRVFNKTLKKAGMRHIRIHDIRHTYATLRIQAGHNIADVSNQLGHHSIKFTMDVYYHWIPGKQKDEVDALDNLHLPAPYTHPNLKKDEKI